MYTLCGVNTCYNNNNNNSPRYVPRRHAVIKSTIAASLQIELGRYVCLPVEERKYKTCSTGMVEDEQHFSVGCPGLKKARGPLYTVSDGASSSRLCSVKGQ